MDTFESSACVLLSACACYINLFLEVNKKNKKKTRAAPNDSFCFMEIEVNQDVLNGIPQNLTVRG